MISAWASPFKICYTLIENLSEDYSKFTKPVTSKQDNLYCVTQTVCGVIKKSDQNLTLVLLCPDIYGVNDVLDQ